jgi:hypothetical protein
MGAQRFIGRHFRVKIACVATLMLAGCALFSDGGSPKPPFDENADLNTLLKNYNQAASLDSFFNAPPNDTPQSQADRRNRFITARLVLINIHYIQFIKGVTADRQLLDSATDILSLSLNLAGASVSSAATKTVLAAIAAGVTGSRAVVERDFYYDKTVPALVAQMNADRKQALIPILQGMKLPIDQYSIANALDDINTYFNAGTFAAAITGIQSNATTQDKAAQKQIRDMSQIPPNAFDLSNAVEIWLEKNTDESQVDRVKQALKDLGDKTDTSTMKMAATGTELKIFIANNVPDTLSADTARAILVKAGILTK